MTQEEKIKDLEERIAIMQADNSKLLSELEHWKKVAAGSKGRNKQLMERIEHYKNLDLEGDHLYEDKIAELDEVKKEINYLRQERSDVVPKKDYEELEKSFENKNEYIEKLQERVQALSLEKATLESTISLQEGVIKDLEHVIDELSKPWWKKVFVKIT
jgi:predicted nuclease with TOPRIM domain